MSAQQATVGQIKCVLLVPRRMLRRRVKRIEAMPFGFDVGTVGQRKTHAAKNLNAPIEHLRERMQRSALVRSARQ